MPKTSILDQLRQQSTNSFSKYQEGVNSFDSKFKKDPTYWELTVDKAKNGFAIIRFLPAPMGEDFPFVRFWEHSFQGPGGWYIEKSLTTFGKQDAIAELNSSLWNTGIESNKKLASSRKRNTRYVSNIQVIKDSLNPETEGRVFRFKYGPKIWDKITAVMNPVIEGMPKFNPFDFWEGASFKLTAHFVNNQRNYDQSTFESPSVISSDDAVIEKIYKSEYSLKSEIASEKFKSYDELKAQLDRVLKNTATMPRNSGLTAEDHVAPSTPIVNALPSRDVSLAELTGNATTNLADLVGDSKSITSVDMGIPVDDVDTDAKIADMFKQLAAKK